VEYDDLNRGKIQHRERSRQILDLSGLRFGNITPTDIDIFMDYHDKCFVFGEVKYEGRPLPDGQKWALERLCDASQKAGKKAMAIIARHQVADCSKDVDVAKLTVCEYRYKQVWREPKEQITVKRAMDIFVE